MLKIPDGLVYTNFLIQEPYGAVGELAHAVRSRTDTLWIEQFVDGCVPEASEFRAELLIDESVIATSYPACVEDVTTPPPQYPKSVQRLVFQFPPINVPQQQVGIRYIAKLYDGSYRRVDLNRSPC